MNKFIRICSIPYILAAVLLSSCNLLALTPTPEPSPDVNQINTAAVQAIATQLTEIATRASPTVTQEVATETPAPLADTPAATPTKTATNPPRPTNTVAPTLLGTSAPEGTIAPTLTTTSAPEGTVTATLSATSEPEGTVAAGVIFQDDFSNASSGWYTAVEENFSFAYENQGYKIINNITTAAIWSVRDRVYGDVILEVDAIKEAGPEDGYLGLICRFQDANNYYAFTIRSNGIYGIMLMGENGLAFLGSGSAEAGVIKTEGETNRLRAECVGDKLAFYANDEKLIEIQNDQIETGSVGLLAGTTLNPGMEVRFDNFAILAPASAAP
jgi:hypothetical protein